MQLQSVKSAGNKEKEKGKEKSEGFEITPKITKEDLLKKYLGFFTSVVKIDNAVYIFDKRGNTYTIGTILPDGTKIVSADVNGVVIEKQGVKVKVPLSVSGNAKASKLPF